MHERKSNSGHTIEWNPDDEQAAAEAMVECPHTECEDHDHAIGGDPEEVDEEVARDVRERYAEKTADPESDE